MEYSDSTTAVLTTEYFAMIFIANVTHSDIVISPVTSPNTTQTQRYADVATMVCAVSEDIYYRTGSAIALFGVILNGLFIYVISRAQSMRITVNVYIVNLAFCDFLLLITVLIYYVLILLGANDDLNNRGFVCYMSVFHNCLLFTSLFTVVVISIERYIGICHPLRFRNVLSKSRVISLVLTTWIIGLVLSIPRTFECITTGHALVQVRNVVYLLYIIFFPVALATVSIMYILTARSFSKFVGQLEESQGIDRRDDERQLCITCAAIATLFFLCLAPSVYKFTHHLIYNITGDIKGDIHTVMCIYDLARWMLLINSVVNPVVYNLINSTGRQAFVQAVRCSSTSPTSSSDGVNNRSPNRTFV
ncbi:pyroglutamylated RF-amide peptide receptor-like [Saccoglossus kowalevskii]|uniref:Tachykinin-like peptides receptor 86C-like n=1 Tax=Saccoglossus kowalevskii TaxID=10224 RepID=A0ABM0LW14_SACKO|nr:PREDICTED: tachykinin-like peptides receptor 86C-like [Saccoglossus kowalevskii]